jgi:DmsE family decaheme c-type cytochrome
MSARGIVVFLFSIAVLFTYTASAQEAAQQEPPTQSTDIVAATLSPGPDPTAARGAINPDGTDIDTVIEAAGAYMGSQNCAECHADHYEQITNRKHGHVRDTHTPFADRGCETCHGPGEKHMLDASYSMITYDGKHAAAPEFQNAMCTRCHQGGQFLEWQASIHENEDLACTSCHVVHKPSQAMDRTKQADVCYQCHQDKRAESYRAYRHPTLEGKVICSDCHNAHGSAGPHALQQLSINDNCYSCHAEKRGPFLWEHAPATEDCSLCHRAHGSNHPALLTRQGPQLCQQCHSLTGTEGRTHTRRFLDFDDSDPGRGRFVVGQNCTNCHSKVHGTNHPSGANLLR